MIYCKLLRYPIKDSRGDVSHQRITTNHNIIRPEMEDFKSILPITGVPITTLIYCVLPISVVVFHNHVNLTLAYDI